MGDLIPFNYKDAIRKEKEAEKKRAEAEKKRKQANKKKDPKKDDKQQGNQKKKQKPKTNPPTGYFHVTQNASKIKSEGFKSKDHLTSPLSIPGIHAWTNYEDAVGPIEMRKKL